MSRNRVIYQSESLFVGPSPATGAHSTQTNPTGDQVNIFEVKRVQNANYSFNFARQDVNQYGELAAIDRVSLENPTVSLDFSYLLANMANEKRLGFTLSTDGEEVSAVSGIITTDEATSTQTKNYFIKTTAEGADVLDDEVTDAHECIGVGNGFITNYTSEAAVGGFPTASITVEGLNMAFYDSANNQHLPSIWPEDGTRVAGQFSLPTGVSDMVHDSGAAVATVNENLSTSVLRPGDIELDLGYDSAAGSPTSDWKVQNYSLAVDLAREPLAKLGSKFAFSREITFPVNSTLTITADVGDIQSGFLEDVTCEDTTYNPMVTIYNPCATKTWANIACRYVMKAARLDSQEFTSSIGANKSVTLTFTSQVGGPNQTTKGIFMSGISIESP